ncbi:MAG: GNAT family N-acetyltransferase [Butyricimonas virosa]|uniref:GNAT family N-acetyltransferase n=1 Tax=Butyricimonas virosa TaxID=544645 RepID=UPI00242DE12B|nr:GNAT family N-acetyltransferase [Butyricimonas virosa]MCI7163897.1 GNAT family N-acetyltransferase [Butyricimonas virosa]MDY5014263.1 GNAT family N-acetyltransferase [Butyricimonas virosa]
MTSLEFVEFDRKFLVSSWKWLTDDEIRMLTGTPFMTKRQQEDWFLSLPFQVDYYIWGVKYNDIPIGACGIKHKTFDNGEYWGYIGEKNYWGRGIGKKMLQFIEQRAKIMNLNTLYLHVSNDNVRAFNLYCQFGYLVISMNGNLVKMSKQL